MLNITFSCDNFRFRWAYCQLEALRHCPLRDISRALEGLPKTLDDTYERILQGIPPAKQEDAHRIFQWLLVSSRPLRVKELAEVFTIDFDAEASGIPKFDGSWRPSNSEASVLSACSTLVSVVQVTDWAGTDTREKVVQFTHFSVKEYLISNRLANSASVAHFHVLPKSAHIVLAKACLSVLIQLDHSIDEDKIQNFPLASYAAEHWVDHARFEDVSLDIRHGMDRFFDRNKPYLAAWIWLYDVESRQIRHRDRPPHPTPPGAVPLYYAALCGIHVLVDRLFGTHPQDLNSRGGYYETPLLAALGNEHPSIALFLLAHGAKIDSRGGLGQTALYMASSRGYTEVVQSLIDRGADLNTVCDDMDNDDFDAKFTPLSVASKNERFEVARVLLEQGADANYRDNRGRSVLHFASRHRSDDLARLLLDHGANLNASDTWGETALHGASSEGSISVVTLLLKYGANVDARSKPGRTPLQWAVEMGHLEVVQLLISHGADVNARKENRWTPLHLAACFGHLQIVEVLLEYGTDPHARNDKGETPFQLASRLNRTQIMRLLSESTGERMEDA